MFYCFDFSTRHAKFNILFDVFVDISSEIFSFHQIENFIIIKMFRIKIIMILFQ